MRGKFKFTTLLTCSRNRIHVCIAEYNYIHSTFIMYLHVVLHVHVVRTTQCMYVYGLTEHSMLNIC